MGRGVGIDLLLKRFNTTLIYSQNYLRPITNYGILNEIKFNPNFSFQFGYAGKTDNFIKQDHNLALIGTKFNIFNNHSFKLMFAYSVINHRSETAYETTGQGFNLYYNGKIKSIDLQSIINYGSPSYTGIFRGRIRMNNLINIPFKNNSRLNIYHTKEDYMPDVYINNVLQARKYNHFDQVEINYNYIATPRLNIFGGPVSIFQNTNNIFSLPENERFAVNTYYLKTGLRIRGENSNNLISGNVKLGYNYITDYSEVLTIPIDARFHKDPYSSMIISVFFKSKYLGAYFNYYHGSYNISQHFSYFYYGKKSRQLRLLPYYERYIFKDIIKNTTRLNLVSDITGRSNMINFSNEISAFLPKEWELFLLGNISFRTTFDAASQSVEKYTNTYFETGLRKAFNFKQPRLKYYNLEIVFYKDINGNKVKDANEPGIRNILTQINRNEEFDKIAENYEYSGEFTDVELISDQFGKVKYENIPQGKYKIKFTSVGKEEGSFVPDRTELEFEVKENTVLFIPFLQTNKLFGKIILNRSKLSNLGRIDISNIRVTATDSKGEVTSCLTDKNGNFIMFLPSVDKYIVSINNIFYENFDLRQNNFVVQLNGYKQFEVAFVFDEKQRKINFAPGKAEDFTLRMVKRTNLSGTVKDASTLQPLAALIQIINDNTREVVTEIHSDKKTGNYFISFITGEDYSILVNKDGYWSSSEKLYLDQITTLQDVTKDILLKSIVIGSKFELQNLVFEPGSASLPNEALIELDRLLRQLRDNPTIRILVAGHSDALETIDNPMISEERAKSVVKYLIQSGFSNAEYVGYRDSQPLTTNDTDEGRKLNRRVEIIVIDK